MQYKEIVSQIENLLLETKFAVLSTVDSDCAPATAQMCLISDGLTVYMQTDKKFEKVSNIRVNPHVAINIGMHNFKGIAEIVGHPSANEWYMNAVGKKHPEAKEKYTNLSDEVLIRIDLLKCKQWHDIDGKEGYLCIDFISETVQQIVVDSMK